MSLLHTCDGSPCLGCDACLALMDERLRTEAPDLLAESFQIVEGGADAAVTRAHLEVCIKHIRHLDNLAQKMTEDTWGCL